MRSVLLAACGTALLVGPILVGTGQAIASPTQTPVSSPDLATMGTATLTPVDEIAVANAVERIATLAQQRYAGYYGGAHWDAKGKLLSIKISPAPPGDVVDRTPEFQSGIKAITDSEKIGRPILVKVPLSWEAQTQLLDKVSKSRGSWAGAAADHVIGVSISSTTGHVSIEADGDLQEIRRAAASAFGDSVAVNISERIVNQGRYNDTSPYSSGNAIWLTQFKPRSRADCTLGWHWRRQDGYTYASTAGHCTATSVFHFSTSQRIGYVAAVYRNDGEYIDHEFVRVTSGVTDASVWVGGPGTSDLRQVVAADNDGTLTGVTVCSSGANGGLVCGVINSRLISVTADDGVTTSRTTCVTPSNPAVLTQGGDSGGPWLSTLVGGTVKAWGQHLGISSCGLVFSTVLNISARTSATLVVK